MLAGSLLLITWFDMSLGTPGAGVCLSPGCCNQPETGNTASWGDGSSDICGQPPSSKQQAEVVVFSFSTAQTTTDMWQTYVHLSCNYFSACSVSIPLAQQTQPARNQKIRVQILPMASAPKDFSSIRRGSAPPSWHLPSRSPRSNTYPDRVVLAGSGQRILIVRMPIQTVDFREMSCQILYCSAGFLQGKTFSFSVQDSQNLV